MEECETALEDCPSAQADDDIDDLEEDFCIFCSQPANKNIEL